MTRRVVIALIAVFLMIVGLSCRAYAYFTSTGSGSGGGSAGTLQAVTVQAFVSGDGPTGTLVPGGSADVILRINNTNAFAVSLFSVDLKSGATITADGGHPACTTTGVTLSIPAADLPVTLFPGSAVYHMASAAQMSTASTSGCQGATFQIPVTIVVHK